MGGAAALLGPSPLPVQALVLESVYPTIDDAVRDRLGAWLGPLGRAIRESVMAWLLPRDGVTATDLRPIDRIGAQTAPLLLLAGTEDPYTPLAKARALFARARAPKAMWEVEGAAHEDLHAFAGAEYERRVGGFLERHLDAAALASAGPPGEGPAHGVEPEEHPQPRRGLDGGAERDRDAE